MIGRIFWAAVAGFLVGVFVRSIVLSGVPFLFAIGIAVICVVLVAFLNPRIVSAHAAAAMLFACALGMLRMDVAVLSPDPVLASYIGERVTLEGRVFAEPDVRQDSVRLSVQVDSIVSGAERVPARAGVLAKLPADANASYGDDVRLSGTLREPQSFDTGFGREFNYPLFLAAQGISYQLVPARLLEATPGGGNFFMAGAISVKHLFEQGLRRTIVEPEAGLAGGITVGDKRSIGPELSADFQRAGVIHMIVLSGYNITIVINGAFWLIDHAAFLKHIRFAPLGVSAIIAIFFMLMSGGASSAVRAGLMALIAVYARFSRRTFLASRALGAVAVAIVAWNPYTLVFDPGFQLSALATAGLIIFTPLIFERLHFVSEKWGLREIASSTLGTQIAVLPLLLYQNGQLPIYALPANLLTLVFVPYAMFFSLVAGVAGFLFGSLGTVFAIPAYILLSYIVHMTQFIAHLPHAGITTAPFGVLWLVVSYALLFEFAAYLHLKRKKK